jgi:hypothetical protein
MGVSAQWAQMRCPSLEWRPDGMAVSVVTLRTRLSQLSGQPCPAYCVCYNVSEAVSWSAKCRQVHGVDSHGYLVRNVSHPPDRQESARVCHDYNLEWLVNQLENTDRTSENNQPIHQSVH